MKLKLRNAWFSAKSRNFLPRNFSTIRYELAIGTNCMIVGSVQSSPHSGGTECLCNFSRNQSNCVTVPQVSIIIQWTQLLWSLDYIRSLVHPAVTPLIILLNQQLDTEIKFNKTQPHIEAMPWNRSRQPIPCTPPTMMIPLTVSLLQYDKEGFGLPLPNLLTLSTHLRQASPH